MVFSPTLVSGVSRRSISPAGENKERENVMGNIIGGVTLRLMGLMTGGGKAEGEVVLTEDGSTVHTEW